jgi:RNA polymerase sigma-70 factor (ECF subfamily)
MRRSSEREVERHFSELYEATAQDILGFLLRRCPTPEDAADCLAETYAIAWDKRERIPAGPDARPWLFGVARNVMRRDRERDGRAGAAARDVSNALATASSGAESPPEIGESVRRALAELPAIDQEIITLIAWDGLTPTEVATVLEMSPNLVRVRAHRARARLRAALAPAWEAVVDVK